MLSALCQLYLLYISSKGGDADELMLCVGEPEAVRMRKPTAEDKKRIEKKKIDRDKKTYKGLIAIAEGGGVPVRTVSKQQFFKELEDVR